MFMQKSSHVFSAAFCIVIKPGNNRNVHQLVNKQTNCGIPIYWNTSQPYKGKVLIKATTWLNLKGIMLSETS